MTIDDIGLYNKRVHKKTGFVLSHTEFDLLVDFVKFMRRRTKRALDGATVCAQCGFPPSHHDPSCYVRRKSPRK